MTLELRPGVSGWWLRVVIGLLGVLVLVLLTAQGLGFSMLIVFGVVVAVAAALPSSPAMTVLIGGAAIATAFMDGTDVSVEAVLLIPVLHLGHVLSAIAGVLPIDSRLHLSAFRRPLRRYLLIQIGVLALVAVAVLLPAGQVDPIIEVAGLLAAAGVALLALPRN
ncbi:hypothetical protein [Kutzneria sp. CA-103260]|uniref:hypothetical protein n=1 Tax=Kutzneria sp. CA-103260 TaxID=2802641 RepID=UPI001BABDC8E|nr:hypothetical protein [Kutzneria sp. CA-103260]QUQ72271.1 hypothetical protein JJ691_100590 [Kutzneria sp. CA-103260]